MLEGPGSVIRRFLDLPPAVHNFIVSAEGSAPAHTVLHRYIRTRIGKSLITVAVPVTEYCTRDGMEITVICVWL